ncbi:MAG: N-acetylmuramic acid 6-phosphate etherase, partial [Candidatus Dormibacteraceae bacterium]
MLERLTTEQTHPESRLLDQLPMIQLLETMSAADAQVAAAVCQEIPRIAAAAEAITAALESGGSLIYIGSGTSGRLGVLDAAECPPTFGVPPDLVRGVMAGGERALAHAVEGVEDDPLAGARDLEASGFVTSDVLVGISASGRTPYVLGAVGKAREVQAVTCGISCVRDSELSLLVQFPIEPVPGPEILTGSTRLRAGTATKLVLNMISTAVMVKLGHVYGNLMVNVQPTNRKLEDRARRIIQAATGVAYEQAAELLDRAGRSVCVAIVMQKKQIPREQAEALLTRAKGRIREALE